MCVQVTGEADENQVCEALRRYRDRECFIREALVHLYSLTTDTDKPQPDVLKVLWSALLPDMSLVNLWNDLFDWVVTENQLAILFSLGEAKTYHK